MEQADLIGLWRCVETGAFMDLLADGTARVAVATGKRLSEDKATWKYIDSSHFSLSIIIPPVPDFEPLKDGAIDTTTYEVRRFDSESMEVEHFDMEIPLTYERVQTSAERTRHSIE